jgi:Uma2 family endonuclease
MMIATLRPLTYDDLRDMPDDSQRCEIIDGVLDVTPAPTMSHQRAVGRLYRLLDDDARQVQGGEVAFAPFDEQLGHVDAVVPGLMCLTAARPRVPNDVHSIDYAPDLDVEVMLPSSRGIARVRKMALTGRSGLSEYWIANPVERTLVVNLLQGKEYASIATDSDGRIVSPTLPGLLVDPAEAFSSLD